MTDQEETVDPATIDIRLTLEKEVEEKVARAVTKWLCGNYAVHDKSTQDSLKHDFMYELAMNLSSDYSFRSNLIHTLKNDASFQDAVVDVIRDKMR